MRYFRLSKKNQVLPPFFDSFFLAHVWVVTLTFIVLACVDKPSEPVPIQPLASQEQLNISYGSHAQQTMDIYLPANRSQDSTKVILFIHGGGWSGGDKSELNNLVSLMRASWPEVAIVNLNYRLVTKTKNQHPSQIKDIETVLGYLKSKEAALGISTTRALLGASAGAHLSMLYANAYDSSHAIQCVANLYGPATLYDWEWYSSFLIKPLLENFLGKTWFEDPEAYKHASPLLRATPQSPPTIIFHGTIDLVVPLYQSQWLSSKLKGLGVPSEYTEYPLDGHGFNATNNADCIAKIIPFFKKHLK